MTTFIVTFLHNDLQTKVEGKRCRGRPKRTLTEVFRKDMKEGDVISDVVHNRKGLRKMAQKFNPKQIRKGYGRRRGKALFCYCLALAILVSCNFQIFAEVQI